MIPPSPWVVRHAPRIVTGGRVLDLACGRGRHARLLALRGYPVIAVDRDATVLAGLHGVAGVTVLGADLEGEDWPLAGLAFAGIVVTNYLWRPRLADIVALLAPGGVLIYETFMVGHEAYGKPSNPDFLLRPGELRAITAAGGLVELDYFEGFTPGPGPAVRQAICAMRP
jgi:SAM-dependent methyltransferase